MEGKELLLLWDKFRTAFSIDAIVLCLWLRHHSEGRGEQEGGEEGEVGCRDVSFLPDAQNPVEQSVAKGE